MIKSIFARPVFINPQAYLVIPQLANLSMLEPIDFTSTNTYSFESLGKVESKIISAKDEYILHIDLYESYGSCVLGEFYIGPATIGSIDDFTITTNGYITTIEVGGNVEEPQYITFADPEVERICVENWSSDGIGCTLEDVQKVTSLNNKFSGNTLIERFDELKEFTSLESLSPYDFKDCINLELISIPCDIQDAPNVSHGAFKGCISLTEVNFTNDDISIGNFAFNECTSLNNISFPNNIKIIGNYTFNGCSSLSEIKNWGNISKNITQIKSYAFNSTMFSYNLELPKLEYLGNFAFARTKLKKITNLGKITIIPRCDIGLFGTSIILLTLPETLTTISAWGLVMPETFKVLICKAVTPPEINAINNLRNAKIYVPDDSVEAYKTATNWSNYADRIHPISEYVPGEEDVE